MKKKLLLLVMCTWIILMAIPANLCFVAVAGGPDGWVLKPCRNWDVVVAVDEEMMASQFWWYSPTPNPIHNLVAAKTYAIRQVLRGTWELYKEFGYTYRVSAIWEWDSTDSLTTTEEVLEECIEQTGWKKSNGGYISGSYIDNENRAIILVAFTKQELSDHTGGIACIRDENSLHPNAILISYKSTQIDDNTVMHEISHLHGCEDHAESEGCKSCVMEYVKEDVWWYNEPCMPIYDGHTLLDLSMWTGCLRGGSLHYEWCDECKAKIANHPNPGCYFEGEGAEFKKDTLFEPWLKEFPKVEPIKPIGIATFAVRWTAIIVAGVIAYYVVRKLLRRRKLMKRRDKDEQKTVSSWRSRVNRWNRAAGRCSVPSASRASR